MWWHYRHYMALYGIIWLSTLKHAWHARILLIAWPHYSILCWPEEVPLRKKTYKSILSLQLSEHYEGWYQIILGPAVIGLRKCHHPASFQFGNCHHSSIFRLFRLLPPPAFMIAFTTNLFKKKSFFVLMFIYFFIKMMGWRRIVWRLPGLEWGQQQQELTEKLQYWTGPRHIHQHNTNN